jgi:carbon-monoxide dehydrogenase medium subunit
VFRFSAAETTLAKRFDGAALDGITLKPDGLNSDIHGSAEYRAHGVVEMAKRAVMSAK